jgi:uncharacterized membrane protein YfcA
MDRKLKMLPVVFMLIAGAITGIITYLLQYEGKNALLILLVVLLLFYGIGFFFRKMIWQFEDEVIRKEKERAEEGKVLEKIMEAQAQKDAENSVKDAGEQ